MKAETLDKLKVVRAKYPSSDAALLPALYLAQKEYGSLSQEALQDVADTLSLPAAFVKGVSTFYAMYQHKPTGRHLIQLCTNVSCMIFGAESLVDLLKEKYNLVPGGTSPDNRFSLVIMECIGACDKAPAMMVNADLHGSLNKDNILNILESYK